MVLNFDPFQSRRCRDIRNDLSESLIESIFAGNIDPTRAAAEKYALEDLEVYNKSYINNRITRYQEVLTQIQSNNILTDETYRIAVLLWDQELFFELHEWLENKWHASEGIEKKVLQTLVRAAGTYVHLQLGRMDSAQKIGSKALAGLIEHKAHVPDIIDVERLIRKIKTLDPIPPKIDNTR